MLWPDDARLVARDPELPGLGVALDAEAFAGWLRHQLPDAGIRGARARYVRYKPGTSCLVDYTVDWAGGEVGVTAKAYRPPALDKLGKAARHPDWVSVLGPAAVVSRELALAAIVFPHDLELHAMRRLLGKRQGKVLDHVLPGLGEESRLHVLSYKPERRAVFRVDGGRVVAVVRVYAPHEFASGPGQPFNASPNGVRLARTLACHPRYPVTATEWLEGEQGTSAFREATRADAIGDAMARLHSAPPIANWTRSAADERRRLRDAARGLADLMPKHAARLDYLSGALGERIGRLGGAQTFTHGDFAARQVVFTAEGVALTDLDEAAVADPAGDLGSFLADVDYRALSGAIDAETAARTLGSFIEGYARVRALPLGVEAYRAAHLLRLAPLPFRARVPDWLGEMERIVGHCESLPWRSVSAHTAGRCAPIPVGRAHGTADSRQGLDPAMPWLDSALDLSHVGGLFADLPWGGSGLTVGSARIRRHKLGRRCLVEYEIACPSGRTVLGKTRAKGLDERTAQLTHALRREGFGAGNADGIEVPPFLGLVPPLRMWLQGAVPGELASDVLSRGDPCIARRLTDVVLKLQRHGPQPARIHTLADELRILEARLDALAARRPEWCGRLVGLIEGCRSIAGSIPDAPLAPAHRDFYPEQVLVDNSRLVLLDLDLYALAHPALDAGNCIAHLIELGLRRPAAAREIKTAVGVMHDTMAAALGPDVAPAIDAFVTLTLARLVEIDDRLEPRRSFVESLMELCEERLSSARALPPRRSLVEGCLAFAVPIVPRRMRCDGQG